MVDDTPQYFKNVKKFVRIQSFCRRNSYSIFHDLFLVVTVVCQMVETPHSAMDSATADLYLELAIFHVVISAEWKTVFSSEWLSTHRH